jgi:hypothetical protein
MAKGKQNKLIIACETREEADTVFANAQRRPEMKYVNMSERKPSYDARKFYVSWHDKQDYSHGLGHVLGELRRRLATKELEQ